MLDLSSIFMAKDHSELTSDKGENLTTPFTPLGEIDVITET